MLREPIQAGSAYWVEVDRFNVKVRAQRETSTPGWWQCVTIPIGTRIVLEAASFRSSAEDVDGQPRLGSRTS